MQCDYKIHPQPSSLRIATQAAKRAKLAGTRVLDCFCGTGTLLVAAHRAGAFHIIGSDIEDYSFCLRKELRQLMKYKLTKIEIHWHIDAFDAIERFDYDILFVDPPAPNDVLGGTKISAKRDTGLHGSEIKRFWLKRLDERNWMNKGSKTVSNVFKLLKKGLESNKRVIINLFSHREFSYLQAFKPFFEYKRLAGNFYEIQFNRTKREGGSP